MQLRQLNLNMINLRNAYFSRANF
ncbi:MAG: pentapeptide repeat-containing protein [cyanobacterium endosymbiont of Rhopalodia sterrenbergii]